MELLFLGTSAGAPSKTRNMTGLAVRLRGGKTWCLVDCAEATQHQILHTNLTLNTLEAVFITHAHGDHCYGLPGLLDSAAMAGRRAPLLIVAPKEIERLIAVLAHTNDLARGFEVQFVDVAQLQQGVKVTDFEVQAYPLSHRVPSYAYRFCEANIPPKLDAEKLIQAGVPRGPIWGQLQQGLIVQLTDNVKLNPADYLLPEMRKRKVIIGGDNDSPELLQQAVQDADVLVHEATYTQAIADKVGSGPQHCSAQRIAQFAQQVGLNNLVLTHFSPRYQTSPSNGGTSIAEIENEAKAHYHGQLFLANDFDLFHLDREGVLRLVATK